MLFLLLLTFLSSFCFYHFYWKRRNFPPGPTPLPIFGNILEMSKHEPGYDAFLNWSKQYGPMHTFWFGEVPIITITDYKMIIDLFVKDGDSFLNRQHPDDLTSIARARDLDGYYGIVFCQGERWRDQRRFTLHVLRNFGLGKNLMQERILVEVSSLIEKIQNDKKTGVEELNLVSYIDITVGSIINNLLFGYRFDGEKLEEFFELKRLISNFLRTFGHPGVAIMNMNVSLAKHLPIFNRIYCQIKEAGDKLNHFYKTRIEEHNKRADHDSEPTDFVEAFLREKAKREAEGNGGFYSTTQLVTMCFDLWIGGQETTSNTLAWGILYLIQEPALQDKLHEELDSVIGSDRIITMDDRPRLNYTNAVVNEIQRITNLLPMNIRHTTSRDVNIKGYHIPKGTEVLPQISAVLYDEKIFPNPKEFDPSRFLDQNGQLKKVDEFIPFGVGKRQCLGESLAKMELFLFTANIFNRFKISQVPNKPPSMERKNGTTVAPQSFVCNIEKRY